MLVTVTCKTFPVFPPHTDTVQHGRKSVAVSNVLDAVKTHRNAHNIIPIEEALRGVLMPLIKTAPISIIRISL